MALPTNIPTSFVPHSSTAPRKFRTGLTSAFDFVAYIILGVVFALALGVFFYGRILAASQEAKDTELSTAEAALDPMTVQNFVRLRDRLSSGKTLLSNHIALSGFFSLFETIVPTSVRIASLHLSIGDKGTVKFEGSGVAKSFNALAAASTAFAKDGTIKDAIFSNIVVSPKDSSVSFSLSASLDPKVIAFSGKSRVAEMTKAVATSTPASPKATQGAAATSTKTTP